MWHKNQVTKGVAALRAQLDLSSSSDKLLDQPENIYLRFQVKKVPDERGYIALPLPKSLDFSSREVCLFVKDLDPKNRDYEPTVRFFQDLLAKNGVQGITKIIPLKALRTDYAVAGAMTSLSQAYDLYLADQRMFSFLPGLLGHPFFGKLRTLPVPVDLRPKNLQQRIEKIIHNGRCFLNRSDRTTAIVAHDRMTADEIVENVMAAAKVIQNSVPGGPTNINVFELKTASKDIIPIPIYANFDSPNDIQLQLKPHQQEVFIDEITTVENGKVRVRADGHVSVVHARREDRKRKSDGDTKTEEENAVSKKLKTMTSVAGDSDDSEDSSEGDSEDSGVEEEELDSDSSGSLENSESDSDSEDSEEKSRTVVSKTKPVNKQKGGKSVKVPVKKQDKATKGKENKVLAVAPQKTKVKHKKY